MATVEKYLLGTAATLMSTELNSLASSATAGAVTASAFNNTVGGGGADGYTLASFELNLAAPAGTLTANTSANVWFLGTVDGTNYEDGSASVIPARLPDIVFPVRAVSTAQRIVRRGLLPWGNFLVLMQHVTGQTWGASGNTLKLLPATPEQV